MLRPEDACQKRLLVFRLESQGAKVNKSCRSPQELSRKYLVAKFGFDERASQSLPNISQRVKKIEKIHKVYDAMITRGFTRPEGYLLMDVHVMIFRGMIDEDCQGLS